MSQQLEILVWDIQFIIHKEHIGLQLSFGIASLCLPTLQLLVIFEVVTFIVAKLFDLIVWAKDEAHGFGSKAFSMVLGKSWDGQSSHAFEKVWVQGEYKYIVEDK